MLVQHSMPRIKWLGVLLLLPGWHLVHHRIPSMKWLGVLLLLPGWNLVHHRIPSIKWLGALLLTPGWDASLQGCLPSPSKFVLLGFPGVSPVLVYTRGWRDAMRSWAACVRKWHDTTQRPAPEPLWTDWECGQKSETLTSSTVPFRLSNIFRCRCSIKYLASKRGSYASIEWGITAENIPPHSSRAKVCYILH